jgi:hypothetical protein
VPPGWLEIFSVLYHSHEFWLGVSVIFGGVIVRYLLWPHFRRAHQAAKILSCQTNIMFEAGLHPHKKDKKERPVHIARYEIVELLEAIVSRCKPSQCPIIPIIKEEIGLLRQEVREHATVTAQSKAAVLGEFDRFVEKITQDRTATEKDFRDFSDRVFEGRAATHEEIVKIFDRFNSYVDGLGSRVIEALEKLATARGHDGEV